MDVNQMITSLPESFESCDSGTPCLVDGKLINFNDEIPLLAIDSSRKAFRSWANRTDRASILKKASETLRLHGNLLIRVDSVDANKHSKCSQTDLDYAVEGFSYYSRLSRKISIIHKSRTPRGSYQGVISGDSASLVALTWLTAAPLAAGNTVVLLVTACDVTALSFAILLRDAGVPAGVLNVVTCSVENLCPKIRDNCTHLMGVIPVSSNLSDLPFSAVLMRDALQSPMLISTSADIDSAIDCFISATQNRKVIWYPNVLYVEEPIYQTFLNVLQHAVRLHNAANEDGGRDSVSEDFINVKKGQGFEVIELVHQYSKCLLLVNHEYEPQSSGIILHEAYRVHRVVSVIPVRTLSEGVSLANNSGGLAVSVWSNDAVETVSIPFGLMFGTVWVNCAGIYCPSVPLSSWIPHCGSFGGKRMLFECSTVIPGSEDACCEETMPLASSTVSADSEGARYEVNINLKFPKEDLADIVKRSQLAQAQWSKIGLQRRLDCLKCVATEMKNDKPYYMHTSFAKDAVKMAWRNCVDHLNFWSGYAVDSSFHQTISTPGYLVLCTWEPLGVICIVAGHASLDEVVFVIAAALAYGNTVVVGVSDDAMAYELQRVFRMNTLSPSAVALVVEESSKLLSKLIANHAIATLWTFPVFKQDVPKKFVRRIVVDPATHITKMAECFETWATKPKCVWLPCLVT